MALSDDKESDPTVIKGAGLGEGRISQFSASTGAVFGSMVRGLRVTLQSNDRRVTNMSQCPEKEFGRYRTTFLAVSRSLSSYVAGNVCPAVFAGNYLLASSRRFDLFEY